jgi:hypothetical protein
MYLDEVEEDDNRIAKAWKEDGDSVLVFVSLTTGLLVHLNEKLKVRSSLRNCWRIHH